MTTERLAIALVIILGIIVAVLNKKLKQHASQKAQEAYKRAAEYADQKAAGSVEHADNLHDNLVSQLKVRFGRQDAALSSLQAETALLQAALIEQTKKLDYFLNIEKAAGEIAVDEDPEARAQALEAVIRGEKSLDDEQELARRYMETSRENLFITGKAGTGKSFLLDAFRGLTKKSNIVLAPTGIAAVNVNGATLHSTFGFYNLVELGVDKISEGTIRLKSEKRLALQSVDTIIIDEISMVRADTLDKIDRILRVVNRSNKLFGGKQMIIFGDLFQLPPIAKGDEWKYLNIKYGGIFFFRSYAFKEGNFKFIELTQNHRQAEDVTYFDVLNRIREGITTDEDIELLNSRLTLTENVYDRYLALVPTKAEADAINNGNIDRLPPQDFIYNAKIVMDERTNKNRSLDNTFQIKDRLRLRKGAFVMIVANDPDHRWVNGSIGIVSDLSYDRIVVSFGPGRGFSVAPLEFEEQEITYADGEITYKTVFKVMQYPIVPAYAITIHKAQGQTFKRILCDLEHCFASGQAYVALSRCTSLEGLHLKSLVSPASVKVDPDVLDFYESQKTGNFGTDETDFSDLPF